MSDNRNRHHDLKRTAGKMYAKMIKVLTSNEIEHFDICKGYISELIFEAEAVADKRQLQFEQLVLNQKRTA
jgi:hypothetical protein